MNGEVCGLKNLGRASANDTKKWALGGASRWGSYVHQADMIGEMVPSNTSFGTNFGHLLSESGRHLSLGV
jgi:hypothetical protein